MPGPMRNPGKPHSRARTSPQRSGLVSLPALGCELDPPDIPAGREWAKHERELWTELWTSPQAVMWDDSMRTAVATYITYSSAILAGKASAWHAQEARHLGAQLGLTPAGLAALGWRIEDGPAAPAPLRGVPS